MKAELKKRMLDLGMLILAISLVVGGLSIYNRLERHNMLVDQIVEILQRQNAAAQAQQATGRPSVVTPPQEEDEADNGN